MKLVDTTPAIVDDLWRQHEPRIAAADHLEVAAQQLIDCLHKRFDESVVLARMFLTLPFDSLLPSAQQFVRGLAGASHNLTPTTPVLSLVGTSGCEADWCDRRRSKGHAGIPLVSSDFVGAIPMISGLLKELGVPLDWVDRRDTNMVLQSLGRVAGLFYVERAADATDPQGRKIIASQEFVSSYGVMTVFGVGGAYSSGQIVVIVVFSKNVVSRSTAEQFLPLVDRFKEKTAGLLREGRVFTAE